MEKASIGWKHIDLIMMQVQFLVRILYVIIIGVLLAPEKTNAQLFTELTRQDTTLVYKLPGYAKDPVRASLKKEVSKKDSTWLVTLSDARNKKIEEISYADEKLEVRKGIYRLYQDEKLIQSGTFDKGYKHGEWKTFFKNGQIAQICNYRWDRLWGRYQKYNNNGKAIEEGQYRNGQKIGTWRSWNDDTGMQLKDYGN